MTVIKENLRYFQVPLRYPRNIVAELFFQMLSERSPICLDSR
jgi:hypothetical protein